MDGVFLTEKEKQSLSLQKIRSGFRISKLEDAEEFISFAQKNLSDLPNEKFLEMLTYTGMFQRNGNLKKEFR